MYENASLGGQGEESIRWDVPALGYCYATFKGRKRRYRRKREPLGRRHALHYSSTPPATVTLLKVTGEAYFLHLYQALHRLTISDDGGVSASKRLGVAEPGLRRH